MKGYKLRPGDLIVGGNELAAFVTKVTPRYIYYFIKNHEGRVSKSSIWEAFDTRSDIEIKYGSMKRRRKQRKMRVLDLHGVKHENVDESLRKFLNFVELPCKIIVGNSEVMKSLVKGVLNDYDWDFHEESTHNPGTLVVVEK